jgi:hypothetical protein
VHVHDIAECYNMPPLDILCNLLCAAAIKHAAVLCRAPVLPAAAGRPPPPAPPLCRAPCWRVRGAVQAARCRGDYACGPTRRRCGAQVDDGGVAAWRHAAESAGLRAKLSAADIGGDGTWPAGRATAQQCASCKRCGGRVHAGWG